MVKRSDGRVTLTKAEHDVVAAVRSAPNGWAEPASRVGTYTRGGETIVTVGPERVVKRLQRAGVLRVDLSGRVRVADDA